jgi:hypothetical protein
VPQSASHDKKSKVLKRFHSKERLMGVSRQAEFSAAKMSKVLLWVEAYMHLSKIDVSPGTLDRMGGGESSGAGHGDQGVDGTDAKFGGARTITIVRARKAKGGGDGVCAVSTARRNSNSATSRSAAARPSRT